MPKRTVEQVIRAEWLAADEAVKRAKAHHAKKVAERKAAIALTEVSAAELEEAIARRTRATAALEAYLGKSITTSEEDRDGHQAAPATTGANDEVQPDSSEAKK